MLGQRRRLRTNISSYSDSKENATWRLKTDIGVVKAFDRSLRGSWFESRTGGMFVIGVFHIDQQCSNLFKGM